LLSLPFFDSHLEHEVKAATGRASPHDPHFFEATGTTTSGTGSSATLHCLQIKARPSREWLRREKRAAGSDLPQLPHCFSSGTVTSLWP